MGFGVVYIEKNYCFVDTHFPPPPFNVRYSALALLTSTKNRFPGQLPSQAPPPTEPTYAPARLPEYTNLLSRKGAFLLWARLPLWATQENTAVGDCAPGSRLLVEKEAQPYKKMYSRVHIRTSKRDFGSQRLRRSLRSSDEP